MLTPDGAGKSTLIRLLTRDVRRLIHELELGITPARIRSTLRQVIPKMRPRRS
jgi:ABC-type multidrug transport system ATPase subunit